MVGLCRRTIAAGVPHSVRRRVDCAGLCRHLRVGWLGCAGRHKKRSQLGLQLTPYGGIEVGAAR